MATNPGLSFKKVASKPTSGMTAGEIYFVTGDKTIYVATSATALAPFYGGEVKNVEYLAKNGETEKTQLKFTMMDGTSWSMDFSDCASATEVTNALNSLNIAYSTTGTATQPVYDSSKTTYLNGSVTFGKNKNTSSAEYVIIQETDDANLKLIRAGSTSTVKISGVNTPTDDTDAANKKYVDSTVSTTVNALTPNLTREEVKDTAGNVVQVHYYVTLSNGKKTNIDDVVAYFIKDGMIQDAELVTTAETGVTVPVPSVPYIKLTFNTDAGSQVIRFSVKDLVDVYTAGNGGITVDGYKINLKLQNASPATDKNILEIASDGLKINTYDNSETVTDGHFIRENSESAPNTWTLKINTNSEKTRIQDVIDGLDSTVTSAGYVDALKDSAQIGAKIVEADGKLTSVKIVTPATLATAASLNTLATQVSNLNITGDNTSSYKPGTLFSGYAGWTNSEKDKYITVSGDADEGTITLQHRTDVDNYSVTLTGIATPTNNTDAANKSYVDSKVSSALVWAVWS